MICLPLPLAAIDQHLAETSIVLECRNKSFTPKKEGAFGGIIKLILGRCSGAELAFEFHKQWLKAATVLLCKIKMGVLHAKRLEDFLL